MTQPNFKEILEYGLRSQLAYTIDRLGWNITEQLRLRSPNTNQLFIQEVRNSEVNVIVEIDDATKTQWIAVRGSSNLKNWVLNFRYLQRSFDRNFSNQQTTVDLHTGFYLASDEVYKAIAPNLNKDYKTRLTGHSLGGAIAVILMMLLQENGYHIEKCITFGQPKVTDAQGAQTCKNLPLIRVVNDDDIVPLLPPGTLLTRFQGGYHHFGERIVLDLEKESTLLKDRQHLDNYTYGFWISLLQAIATRDAKDSTDNIKDHNLSLYLLNILNKIETKELALTNLLHDLSSQVPSNVQQLYI
jgi:triacylglycerol lipase